MPDNALELQRLRAGAYRGAMQTPPICLFYPIELDTNISCPDIRTLRLAPGSFDFLYAGVGPRAHIHSPIVKAACDPEMIEKGGSASLQSVFVWVSDTMNNRNAFVVLVLGAGMACFPAQAVALDNPLVVHLQGTTSRQQVASATIFGSGSSVLVNVTANRRLPKNVAVTLNRGTCAHPGAIAFALERVSGGQSLTELHHALTFVAQRAKSMVVHRAFGERSPVFACGAVAE